MTPQTLIAHYRVTAKLGEGGMGVVYQAVDTKLNRKVAIKVLRHSFSANSDLLVHVKREAQMLASLNHANIAAIYGIEENAIVMELVEGDTLADRLARGPLPVAEALRVALQIAEALEAAHANNIIHRDLKPANIKVTHEGKVKLLDFGLARELMRQPGSPSTSELPTQTATAPGIVMGTPAYMSPEQARAFPIDRRTDIWAFGCVLYELLSGKRVFRGETATDTLAAVLRSEPDWLVLPADTPEAANRVLHRCLQRDPAHRLHDMADARLELEDALTQPLDRSNAAARQSGSHLLSWILATIAAAVLLALFVGYQIFRDHTTRSRTYHVSLALPDGWTMSPYSAPAVSPDGRKIAIAGINVERKGQIWIRSLDTGSTQPLGGTDGGRSPFWSPDSSSIGFFGDDALKTIAIAGGVPSVLCPAPNPRGGAWSTDGTIIYAPEFMSRLHRVPARGGDCSPIMRPLTQGESPRWPAMLPDGRRFLYWSAGTVYLATADANEGRKVLDNPSSAVYVDNHLLFVRGGALMAQRFDPDTIKVTGAAVQVADRVLYRLLSRGMVSASPAGVLAYRTGPEAEAPELALLDSNGKLLGVLGARLETNAVAFSPDGTRLAFDVVEPDGSSNIWLYDLGRNVKSRLTFHSRFARAPVWSPDGLRVVFTGTQHRGPDLYVKNSDGSGDEELLAETPDEDRATAWSPDGRQILFDSTSAATRQDLWALSLVGNRNAYPYLRTRFAEHSAAFSPDGKWIAFVSDQSGTEDVYASLFPLSGRAVRISTGGAGFPKWSRDGREIIYYSIPVLGLVATSVQAAQDTLLVGTTRSVFRYRASGSTTFFDIAPDNRRFVVIRAGGPEEPDELHLLINWPAMLKQ